MSTGSPSTLRPWTYMTPNVKIAIVAWFIVIIGALVLHSVNSANTTALRNDMNNTRKTIDSLRQEHEARTPEWQAELSQVRVESRSLIERISQLESNLGQADTSNPESALTASELAVRKANAVKNRALANAAVHDLGKLKTLQAEWATLEATLLNGQEGKRIVGSVMHLERVISILQSARPSAEQIVEWESRLAPLTEPFTLAAAESIPVAITDEHKELLSDLGRELKTAASEFERQKLLFESVDRETSGMQPSPMTLAEAIEQHRVEQEAAEVDRLEKVRDDARSEAEKAGAERIVKAEKELADAKIRAAEQKIDAEREQVAEEARVADMQRKATLAGLTEEATRVADELRWVELERQMQRDMDEIRGLLRAFTSPGFAYRPDDTKGPVSYSLIKSSGGLESTRNGLGSLFFIATGNTDRERGGLPAGVGGHISSSTPTAPIERAQELLVKYGELMVRKGMLAP